MASDSADRPLHLLLSRRSVGDLYAARSSASFGRLLRGPPSRTQQTTAGSRRGRLIEDYPRLTVTGLTEALPSSQVSAHHVAPVCAAAPEHSRALVVLDSPTSASVSPRGSGASAFRRMPSAPNLGVAREPDSRPFGGGGPRAHFPVRGGHLPEAGSRSSSSAIHCGSGDAVATETRVSSDVSACRPIARPLRCSGKPAERGRRILPGLVSAAELIDRASRMRSSCGARAPFLDEALFAAARRLSSSAVVEGDTDAVLASLRRGIGRVAWQPVQTAPA